MFHESCPDQGRRRRGGGGVARIRTPALLKTAGKTLQKFGFSRIFFLERYKNCIFQHFQNKVAKSEEKLNFGGMWVWVPMNPSAIIKSSRRSPCPDHSSGFYAGKSVITPN